MPFLTRREFTLILFALSAFLIAYNYESSFYSLSTAAIFPGANSSFSATQLLSVQDAFRDDGRRNTKYTDDLESKILGDWEIETRKQHDLGPYGLTENNQFSDWSNGDIPQTKLVGHVPGYTILENVLLANGALYLVHNLASQIFPKTEMILSTGIGVPGSNLPPVSQELKFLTRSQALDIIGYGAHRMANTTIICFDHPHSITNETFLAFYRAYSTLSPPVQTKSGPLPPSQIILPNVPRDSLSETAYYPSYQLSRIAFPFLNHIFSEDFTDFGKTERPIILDQVLLADRVAAESGTQTFDFSADVKAPFSEEDEVAIDGKKSKKTKKKEYEIREATLIEPIDKRLPFASAFALPAPRNWVSPLSAGALILPTPQSLTTHAKKSKKARKAVTYVSTQARSIREPQLREADHENLLRELRKAGEANGFDVYVVELGSERIEGAVGTWRNLVSAAVRSSVMLGVHGDTLTYAPLLQPGSGASVIEFFPDGKFVNDHEFITRSLDIGYVAWRNTKKYTRGNLPPISPITRADSRLLSIDVHAIVNFVKEQLRK